MKFTDQELTEEQKTQARKNIDAISFDDALKVLPSVTASDNGKFLRVVNGSWAAATIPNAEEANF